MNHTQVLIRETLREAENNRPGKDDRHQLVTSAHNELVEAVRIAPSAVRTLKVALRLRDLLLLERLAAEARKSSRSTQAQAAAALRVAGVDYDPEQVRTWATAHGIAVPTRGRYLPGPVIHAYREAMRSNPDDAPATAPRAPGARSARSSSSATATSARSRSRQPAKRAASRPRTPDTSSPTPSAAPTTPTTSAASAKRTRPTAAAKSGNS